MANPQTGFTATFRAEAATNLSGAANIGLAVAVNTAGRLVLATSATGVGFAGILLDGGLAAGGECLVCVLGPCKIRLGAATNEGAFVRTAADSRMDPVNAANDFICGKVFQAGADGDEVDGMVLHGQTSNGATGEAA